MSTLLGIDLGTSSIKILLIDGSDTYKAGSKYESCDPNGWYEALCSSMKSFPQELVKKVSAVGLSSQVGTYICGDQILSWQSGAGIEEVKELIDSYDPEFFVKEIGMRHPKIASYPIPRMTWLSRNGYAGKDICQPKDLICRMLTGNLCTDLWSWRGLANPMTHEYSRYFIEKCGFTVENLPKLLDPQDLAGNVTVKAFRETGIPAGTPVFLGCNDYYAALCGMNVVTPGTLFDLTGTSEHVGLISDHDLITNDLVSGPYFDAFVTYGVTASSGASTDLAIREFGLDGLDPYMAMNKKLPIFLPYVNGERAPIWDPLAKGVFFGIGADTTRRELAYAVVEGVAFSLYHIYGNIPGKGERMYCAGGAASDKMLCTIKASLFGVPVISLEQKDASALGAAIWAGVGSGVYKDRKSAAASMIKERFTVYPDEKLGECLKKRFEIYRGLYPSLQKSFSEYNKI